MIAAIVWPLVGAGVLLVAVGLVLLAISRKPANASADIASAPARFPVPALTGPVSKHERAIAWPRLIDPEAGAYEPDERRRIIDGLAVIGDPWCATVLAQAYGEEIEALKETVIDAIGRCRGEVAPTLERALKSHRTVERYAAVDAASKRGDVEILERGMRDTDGTVALAAAYGLARAGRRDLIEAGLAGRDDARASEIRRVLPVLATFVAVVLAALPLGVLAQASPAPADAGKPRIHLHRPGTDVDADELVGNLDDEHFQLRGNVIVHSDPKVDPDAAQTESDEPFTLDADRVDVDRKTKRYDAIGHVNYVQGDRYGKADSATLDEGTHDLDLIGHALVGEGGRKTHADRIHYNTRSRHFDVLGNVEAVSPVPTPTPYTGKPTPAPKKRKLPLPI
jgi:lipopolysaccharide export system protein LptA